MADPNQENLGSDENQQGRFMGTVLEDRYELLDELGQGGMGVVYRAWHRLLERHVAVKMLHSHVAADEGQLLAMRAEARIIAELQHPNIVAVHAFGTTSDGAPYVVMELLDGEPLSNIVAQETPMPLERCVDLSLQVAHALEFAHGKGIVHRDLKPSNVVVTRGPDGDDHVKIVDFGIARRYEQFNTQTHVVGSPLYMSPGQLMGKRASVRSDLYSLGCVLHETTCGAPPFIGETPIDTMRKQISEPPPELRSLRKETPVALQNIVLKLLAKEPDHRYQSARELIDDLTAMKKALSGQGVEPDVVVTQALPVDARPKLQLPWKRIAVVGSVMVVLGAAGVVCLKPLLERDRYYFDPGLLTARQKAGEGEKLYLESLPKLGLARFDVVYGKLQQTGVQNPQELEKALEQALADMPRDPNAKPKFIADSTIKAARYFGTRNDIRRWHKYSQQAIDMTTAPGSRVATRYVPAVCELARVYEAAGDPEFSLNLCDVAQSTLPENAAAASSRDDYRAYTVIVPTRMVAYWGLGDNEKALEMARIISNFEVAGHQGEHRADLLQALNRAGKPTETLALGQSGEFWQIEWKPPQYKVFAKNEVAEAYIQLHDLEDAKKELRSIIDDPATPASSKDIAAELQRSRLLLAKVLQRQKRYAEEVTVLREALKIEAETPTAVDRLLEILHELKRACKDANDSRRFEPYETVYQELLAEKSSRVKPVLPRILPVLPAAKKRNDT